MNRSTLAALAGGALLALAAPAASAAPLGGSGFAPRVPVSPLALQWFDPSRLQVSTMIAVGSGWGGGAGGLQTTRFTYQFAQPAWMSVSLGNAFGSGLGRASGKFFLEGLDFGIQPLPGMTFQVHYRDFRSPLQASPLYHPLRDYWGR